MTAAMYTGGPWTFEPPGESEDCPLVTGGKRNSHLVCTMPDEQSEDGYTEAITEANARLIAAAPAYALAWSMVPDEIRQRIYDALHKPDTEWVEATIHAAGGE